MAHEVRGRVTDEAPALSPAVDDEVRKARHTRYAVTAVFVAVVSVLAAAGLAWRVDRERECEAAREARTDLEAIDVGVWQQAHDDGLISDDTYAAAARYVRNGYDRLDEPAPCHGIFG